MDKYVKIKMIGEGSFGKALLVRSKETGKQLVVKEINMSKMGQKERGEARKETAVLAQLNHPNIVLYRESFEEVGNLYIVMDYCDGGDLYSRINQCRGILMSEDMILDWFVQICLSIKHIHDRKILHRDIKSQNIFLTKHGIVKLGDFGIAKVLNSTVELARTCIGTPYYLSPEIVENKPYNNKSDIWSLGCVLYEMTTLKHAFEAGNMKNLVLKIIRGSYPPVSPQYSYDIRNLIALLFKRNARDRPSINAVLRKPLLQNRIKKFLTENEYCDEFSHTIMHGQKIQKALPAGQRHVAPVRAVSSAAKKPPATPRYNPASVYAPSVARKSREAAPKVRKSSEAPRKSSDSGAARKSVEAKRASGGVNSAQSELAKRRQELVQKEKARQEAARLREQQYARQHKELQDRQKMARMAKAREEGWKSLLDSDESVSSNKKAPSPKRDEPRRISPSPVPSKPSVQAAAAGGRDRGQYEHYHAYLDKLEQDKRAALRPTPQEPPGAHGAGAPVGGVAAALGGGALYGGAEAARAAQYGDAAGARGADAAKRAKILEEYLQRKRDAAMNKARGVNEVHGGARPSSARPANDGAAAASAAAAARAGRPVSAREAHRKQQEDEYMSRLKQIRLNNFNERRMQHGQEQPQAQKPSADPTDPQEVRRKKIEALRAQADDRARRLKSELEKKRREAYGLEQQRLQAMAKARAAPPVPMTDAMKAIGAAPMSPPVIPAGVKPPIGMTAAMEAIGVAGQGAQGVLDKDKSPLQKKKEEILKRLNSKPKEKPVKKWGEPVEPLAERPKWCEAGDSGDLSHMRLEETASHMEATNVNDGVTRYDKPAEEDPPSSARRQWGGRAGTVLNMLQGADLAGDDSDGSAALASSGSSGAPTPSPRSPIVGPGKSIGTTITLSKKGTQVLARASLPVVSENKGHVTEAVRASVPVSVPMKADAPKLFDKVEFDDDDDDATREKDDMVLEDIDDQEDGQVSARMVKAGLQTGQFDVGNIKMLRTCSEPDLSKLFRTTLADNPFFKQESDGHASLDLPTPSDDDDGDDDDADNDDDDDDDAQDVEEEIEDSQDNEAEGQSEGREGDDEDDGTAGDEDDEDEDEDDLQTVRESMMSLLADDDEDEDSKDTEKTLTPTSEKKKVKKSKKLKSRFKKKKGRSIKDVDSSGEGDTSTGSNMMRSESAEDFVSMRATMRDVLASIKVGPVKKQTCEPTSSGAGDGKNKDETDTPSTIEPGRESWQSDEDDEDFFEDEDDDMFSRLEEKRVCLEQDLGCDTFLKAYKTVQAIHEDEDENMEEGIRLVSRILGDDKAHLYPAILQLVMADGVFMEDNS